jgi:hypothetical protein
LSLDDTEVREGEGLCLFYLLLFFFAYVCV